MEMIIYFDYNQIRPGSEVYFACPHPNLPTEGISRNTNTEVYVFGSSHATQSVVH